MKSPSDTTLKVTLATMRPPYLHVSLYTIHATHLKVKI